MLGKSQITIASTQFTAGLATSDFTTDGGIGTTSTNLSMIAQPGVVRAMPTSTPTKSGAAISGGIVASCESPETTTTHNYRWFVDNGGSTLFSCDDTSYLDQTNSLPSISAPNTDMAVWASSGVGTTDGYLYISNTNNVIEIGVSNSTGSFHVSNTTWWSATLGSSATLTSSVPHPLLVYEQNLWVGDQNVLRSAIDRSTLGVTLTLNKNERIQCLAIDPNTGLMMIGVRTVSGNNDTFSGQSFIYLYNGIASKATRKIAVDGRISSFKPVGGQVFVGMNNTIGVWNGNGITFMRRLYNVSDSTSDIPYKNKMTSFQNTLLVVDGQYILAYGDISNGKKAWWPFYKHSTNIASIFFIGNVNNASTIPESPLIAVNDSSNLFYVRPMDTTTAATGVFYTNNINFERPVNIRGMRVFTTGITTTAGIGGVSLIDENNTTYTPEVNKFVVASGTRYVFDFTMEKKLQTLQPKLTIDTQAFGIVRVIIYYDVAE